MNSNHKLSLSFLFNVSPPVSFYFVEPFLSTIIYYDIMRVQSTREEEEDSFWRRIKLSVVFIILCNFEPPFPTNRSPKRITVQQSKDR
jgi:hypothetical protein